MVDFDKIKVGLLKFPTEQEWRWCKTCTLNTVGKKLKSNGEIDPSWKRKILESEHSPIRELWFGFRLTIPYWVSVHLIRHSQGINHYVQTQRTDRTNVDRDNLPQGAFVSHIISINAQELMYIARKRLCKQASEETRYVVKLMCDKAIEVCPELKGLLAPLCVYRNGKCSEFFPCKQAPNNIQGTKENV